ncbi:hypothetical protein AAFF_G00101060 [Aldrovandia affinis]|uniref:Uncharacterized protein n=1 Tax=Aldrovandia affinis TaxID=143900 RepID=A0AAD7RXC3_9TELE|nr:hypothetical protein AAFF_G00101060 [Aldrovandia affinis]
MGGGVTDSITRIQKSLAPSYHPSPPPPNPASHQRRGGLPGVKDFPESSVESKSQDGDQFPAVTPPDKGPSCAVQGNWPPPPGSGEESGGAVGRDSGETGETRYEKWPEPCYPKHPGNAQVM